MNLQTANTSPLASCVLRCDVMKKIVFPRQHSSGWHSFFIRSCYFTLDALFHIFAIVFDILLPYFINNKISAILQTHEQTHTDTYMYTLEPRPNRTEPKRLTQLHTTAIGMGSIRLSQSFVFICWPYKSGCTKFTSQREKRMRIIVNKSHIIAITIIEHKKCHK